MASMHLSTVGNTGTGSVKAGLFNRPKANIGLASPSSLQPNEQSELERVAGQHENIVSKHAYQFFK